MQAHNRQKWHTRNIVDYVSKYGVHTWLNSYANNKVNEPTRIQQYGTIAETTDKKSKCSNAPYLQCLQVFFEVISLT